MLRYRAMAQSRRACAAGFFQAAATFGRDVVILIDVCIPGVCSGFSARIKNYSCKRQIKPPDHLT
jgi:hypothetical protein